MVYEKVSEFGCRQIEEMAKKYFKGEGLELEEENKTCLDFKGGGGYVSVKFCSRDRENRVDVEFETSEWDKQVKKFMRRI